MWAYLTSDKFPVRAVVTFLVFGFVGIGLTEALRLTTRREAKASDSTKEGDVTKSPHTSASLQLSDISVFKDNSVIEAGKKLAFRVSFANKGPLPVIESRMVLATAITWEIGDEKLTNQLADNLRVAVRRALAEEGPMKGPPVGIGNSIFKDIITGPLEHGQVQGLLKGTARVYLLAWVGWLGSDELKGEQEVCLFMQKPQSHILQAVDIKNWGICPIPASTPLW